MVCQSHGTYKKSGDTEGFAVSLSSIPMGIEALSDALGSEAYLRAEDARCICASKEDVAFEYYVE